MRGPVRFALGFVFIAVGIDGWGQCGGGGACLRLQTL
jgi:hypothetical protein